MKRILIKDALKAPVGQQVTLGGWVRSVRSSKGGFSFVALYDGSCFATIQIVADGKLIGAIGVSGGNSEQDIEIATPGANALQ